jgi:hypothetical protein
MFISVKIVEPSEMAEGSADPTVERRTVLAALGLLGSGSLAGCSLSTPPTAVESREFAFSEQSSEVGFEYSPRTDWIGNGHSGVYVADIDNDLWPEILAVGGPQPVLFENDGGTFTESDALPTVDRQVTGALFFDHDNDGWQDLLLLAENATPLFLENDEGEFSVSEMGFDTEMARPIGATAADYDRDGRLEVFVFQYGNWADTVPAGYLNRGRVEDDNGFENYLYAFDGTEFSRVEDAGIEGEHWSLAASFVDLTGDSLPDIHVANDFNNDVLYLNRGDGTFDRQRLGSVTDRNAMSSEVVDINEDGDLDLFVTNIGLPIQRETLTSAQYQLVRDRIRFLLGKRIEGNNVLVNQGDGEFTDRAEAFGVQEGGWGWAAVVADFDNDAQLDIFHTTSLFFRIDREEPHYTYPMVWQGDRESEAFEQLDASAVGFLEKSGRGAAGLDATLDGRRDIAVGTFEDDFVFYANETDAWNCVQVRPTSETIDAPSVGAEVTVTVAGESRRQVMNCKADYQSQDSRFLHFGLGEADELDRLEVDWPGEAGVELTDVAVNRRLVVTPDGIRRSTSLE